MISHIHRSKRSEREPSAAWLAIGYLSLTVLLVSNAVIAA